MDKTRRFVASRRVSSRRVVSPISLELSHKSGSQFICLSAHAPEVGKTFADSTETVLMERYNLVLNTL